MMALKDKQLLGSRIKSSAGFTLIEILVAVLVLSFGVLGMIGMEGLALKNNHSAYQRTQATLLTYDLADRIRIDRANMADYETGGAGNAEVAEWEARLVELLPNAKNTREIVSGGAFKVTITWVDNREKTGNQNTTFESTFRP